jgi:hypothetical protein
LPATGRALWGAGSGSVRPRAICTTQISVALARRKPPARSDAECADVVIGRARL